MHEFSIWQILIVFAAIYLLVVMPTIKIVARTGRSTAMGVAVVLLLMLFPPLALWVVATMNWPALGKSPEE